MSSAISNPAAPPAFFLAALPGDSELNILLDLVLAACTLHRSRQLHPCNQQLLSTCHSHFRPARRCSCESTGDSGTACRSTAIMGLYSPSPPPPLQHQCNRHSRAPSRSTPPRTTRAATTHHRLLHRPCQPPHMAPPPQCLLHWPPPRMHHRSQPPKSILPARTGPTRRMPTPGPQIPLGPM